VALALKWNGARLGMQKLMVAGHDAPIWPILIRDDHPWLKTNQVPTARRKFCKKADGVGSGAAKGRRPMRP